ncbi:hypothetical protein ASD30_00060 [Nocardioides sp. Root140]|nr:hypothetical protein ASD30_00060 [Nocardioides sp. Root140]KRF17587.1 hypothetical protein ASH02_25365 [Nocardioides sp. Soil796]
MLLPAEDMPVGQDIDCGPYQVTENEVVEFASARAPQYVHVDRDLAAHTDVRALDRQRSAHGPDHPKGSQRPACTSGTASSRARTSTTYASFAAARR